MILNGVNFGRAWCASGARSFLGDGYPFHRWLKPFGLAPDFRGSTFVAKTTTLHAREGNLPLDFTTLLEIKPRCIKVNFRRGAVLNAVGLSGPGLGPLLARGTWQAWHEPFVLSFMSVCETRERRLAEARFFAEWLAPILYSWSKAPFALELNFSCPNVGIDPSSLIDEVRSTLILLGGELDRVPLIPKLNILVPPAVAVEIGRHHSCAAICVSNTLPWGSLPDRIDWRGLFGEVSPLAEFGGGGLSGAPLTPLVLEWVNDYCARPHAAPLVAGGGVMRPGDAVALLDAGAEAVEVGSVAITRPWRVKSIIEAINAWKGKRCQNNH